MESLAINFGYYFLNIYLPFFFVDKLFDEFNKEKKKKELNFSDPRKTRILMGRTKISKYTLF